jgi:hypothetical protein
MTTQEAMGMPGLNVSLSREAVYSTLAFLKRHKAKKSPRAVRFELLPGKAPAIVLEPWEERIVSYGTTYDGPSTEPIRIWGARRLLVLARLLPLAERFDVLLLGTGLPSFWVARMGEMQSTLGLSGWTSNDWTRGSALDLLAPPATITPDLLKAVGRLLQERRSLSLSQLETATQAPAPAVTAALRRLAFAGQVIHDLPHGVYRFRQVMPVMLGATPDADPRFDARIGTGDRARAGAVGQGRIHASGNPGRSRWPHPSRQVSLRAFSPLRRSQRALPAYDRAQVPVGVDSLGWIAEEHRFCVNELTPGASSHHESRVGRVRVRLPETISTALRRG